MIVPPDMVIWVTPQEYAVLVPRDVPKGFRVPPIDPDSNVRKRKPRPKRRKQWGRQKR
jgi:hypothetical protein